MDPKGLIHSVDEECCVELLSELVRFESCAGTPGEAALSRLLAERMERIGLDASLQPVDGERCNAVGVLRGTGGGRSLLLNGHVDTNPLTRGWTVGPWSGLVRDGFVYGLGVSNMKAGDAACFCAVKTLVERGVKLRGDVVLTFVVGELQGGIGTLRAIKDLPHADCFVNCEPTDMQAVTRHAGNVHFTIELEGATRHLSKRGEAVDALAAACALAARIAGAAFGEESDRERRRLNCAHVGVLRAALTSDFDESRPAQVADFARMEGSARYAPGRSEESALADLRRLLDELEAERPGLRAHLRVRPLLNGVRPMLPFEVDRGEFIVGALNRAYEAVRGEAQPTGAIAPACLYWTDAAHLLHHAGLPGVVCGPGGKHNTMPDERVAVADYLDMIRVYMLTILDVCG